jgi:hypothetical protein
MHKLMQHLRRDIRAVIDSSLQEVERDVILYRYGFDIQQKPRTVAEKNNYIYIIVNQHQPIHHGYVNLLLIVVVCVGSVVGIAVGMSVGMVLGLVVGASAGFLVGNEDGTLLGFGIGTPSGAFVRKFTGDYDGSDDL